MKRILIILLLMLACAAHADQAQVDPVDAALAAFKAAESARAAAVKTLQDERARLTAQIAAIDAALGGSGPGPVTPPAVLSTNAAHVRDLCLGAVTDRSLAPLLAAVYSATADKIKAGDPLYADEAGAVKQTGQFVQSAISGRITEWRPFFTGLQQWLADEKAAGRLTTSAAREAYWRDIASGLASVAGVKQR